MIVIGLGHYSRTGKDSFANYFLEELAVLKCGLVATKIPFAWKLKRIAYELYAWDGMQPPEFYETPEGAAFRDVVLPHIGKTPVEIWIDLGTPAVREQVYQNTWIDFVLRSNHNADILLIPDVRFPNEVAAVRQAGGTIIKVVRPGYGPRKSVADRALLGFTGWDYVIGASGKMSELHYWAHNFAAWQGCIGSRPYQSDVEKHDALAVEKIEPWEGDGTNQALKLRPDADLRPKATGIDPRFAHQQPVTGRIGDQVHTFLPPIQTLDDTVTRSIQGNQ